MEHRRQQVAAKMKEEEELQLENERRRDEQLREEKLRQSIKIQSEEYVISWH